jgi:hypothetical protein
MKMTLALNTPIMRTLQRALSTKRPDGGQGVIDFTQWLIDNVPTHLQNNIMVDASNNVHIDARTEPAHRTLFVAHVDTVHHEEGKNHIVKETTKKGYFWRAYTGSCLGADDGAGVAMLMHMIHGGVAGYYVFTQGEECGGIGAKFLARHHPEILDEFDRAIAFDRRGIESVITHQGCGRCCSDKFGIALADALNDAHPRLMYLVDNTGVYTDTAEFIDNIPECTNISVGYYGEHGDREYLDMYHFEMLSMAVLKVDWDNLPVERDPKVVEKYDWGTSVYGHTTKYGKMTDAEWAAMADEWDDMDGYGDRDWALYDVRGALEDARDGYVDELIYLIGESVYPEDPDAAKRFLNAKRLTEDVIDKMMDMTYMSDAPTVLCTIFDTLYEG